jgi:hypothetical protein
MREDFHPKIMHHLLACHLHGIDLKEIQSKMDDQDENDEKGDGKDPFYILPSQDEKILFFQFPYSVEGDEPVRTTSFERRGIFS